MDRAYSLIAEETHRTQPSRDLIHMDMLELNEENENLSWSLHFTLNRKDLTWKIVSHDVNFNQSGNSLETSRRVQFAEVTASWEAFLYSWASKNFTC